MKKLTFTLALLLVVMISNAQKDFQGMAVYQTKTSTSDMKAGFSGNRDFTPEMRKAMEDRFKKMTEKTFILNFDKTASIYKEEEKLEAPGQQAGGMRFMSSMMGGGGTYYKNAKEKTFTVDKEFMGKEFLVKDTLRNYNWKMGSETREIGGYTCYKATAVIPASKTDFRNFRPKKEEDVKKKEEGVKKKEEEKKEGENKTEDATAEDKKEKKTSFFGEIELPKEITITAWYTMDIPVSQGPEGYWGLPGLILEVNDGRTTILCSKIVINPNEKVEIKSPITGKVVTQKEYDDIVTKKMEELMEMNQGQGRGGMQMRMGR